MVDPHLTCNFSLFSWQTFVLPLHWSHVKQMDAAINAIMNRKSPPPLDAVNPDDLTPGQGLLRLGALTMASLVLWPSFWTHTSSVVRVYGPQHITLMIQEINKVFPLDFLVATWQAFLIASYVSVCPAD